MHREVVTMMNNTSHPTKLTLQDNNNRKDHQQYHIAFDRSFSPTQSVLFTVMLFLSFSLSLTRCPQHCLKNVKVQNQTTQAQWPEILWPLYSTHTHTHTHRSCDKRGSIQSKSHCFVSNITGGKNVQIISIYFYCTLYSWLQILQWNALSLWI